jgi:hypothetical protein
MARRKWSDLSKRTRRWLIAGASIEGSLKIAALVDIARRPASQIRGRKAVWIPVITLANSAGTIPLAYFFFGRRP